MTRKNNVEVVDENIQCQEEGHMHEKLPNEEQDLQKSRKLESEITSNCEAAVDGKTEMDPCNAEFSSKGHEGGKERDTQDDTGIDDDDDDDEFNESFLESIQAMQNAGTFDKKIMNRNQHATPRVWLGDYQVSFKPDNQFVARPMAAYSRHLVSDVKENERKIDQYCKVTRTSSYAEPKRNINSVTSNTNEKSSLLLAKRTEDVWRNLRTLTNPGDKDEFLYTAMPNIPEEIPTSGGETSYIR